VHSPYYTLFYTTVLTCHAVLFAALKVLISCEVDRHKFRKAAYQKNFCRGKEKEDNISRRILGTRIEHTTHRKEGEYV
jgi:hypothetical protein